MNVNDFITVPVSSRPSTTVWPSLSMTFIVLVLSLLELIAYTFTADSPAVLNAIALFVVLPAPPSLILFTKLIPSNVFLLPSTTTVSSSVAITANPFFTFLDVIVPCAKSLALSTSVSPIAEAVVASVALVVSSAFVVSVSEALVVCSGVTSVPLIPPTETSEDL